MGQIPTGVDKSNCRESFRRPGPASPAAAIANKAGRRRGAGNRGPHGGEGLCRPWGRPPELRFCGATDSTVVVRRCFHLLGRTCRFLAVEGQALPGWEVISNGLCGMRPVAPPSWRLRSLSRTLWLRQCAQPSRAAVLGMTEGGGTEMGGVGNSAPRLGDLRAGWERAREAYVRPATERSSLPNARQPPELPHLTPS